MNQRKERAEMRNNRASGWKKGAVTVLIAFACALAGCGDEVNSAATSIAFSHDDSAFQTVSDDTRTVTIGFAQVGEESDWRRANSDSIRDTFSTDKGYNLLFEDAQNDPDTQISDVSRFIQQGVDYIVLEPIVETGWDKVLQEVKDAGIPVIVADRQLTLEDDSLYTAWTGSNPDLEGKKVCAWIHAFAEKNHLDESTFQIGVIQGTIGSSPQIGRERALREAAAKYRWSIAGSEKGEFTQAKGREAMDALLKKYPDINIVYCDNDNEAYGAIEALQAAGRKIGTDIEHGEIVIVAFDGAKKALKAVQDGLIACDGECNPLLGPKIEKIIEALKDGKTVSKIQYVDENIYAQNDDISSVSIDGVDYPVTPVTDELLESRVY